MYDEQGEEIKATNRAVFAWMSRLTEEWEKYDLSELTDLSALGLRLCVWCRLVELKFPLKTWNEQSKRKVRMTAFVTGEWEILLPDEVQRIVPGWIETTVFVQPNKRQKIRLTQEGLRAKHNPDMTWMGSLEICLFNHTFYQPGKVSLRVLDDVTGTTESAQPIQFNGPVTAHMGDVHVAGAVNFHADVISERQFFRHRSRGGFRIGDGKTVDLLRYVAWLVQERHKPAPEPSGDPYETLKDRARARNAALSLAGRDIGELLVVVNPQRKQQAESDFRHFCEVYFPQTRATPLRSVF